MKKNLFVLIDFSPYSESLVNFAATWRDLLQADLFFVHQVHAFAPAMSDADSRQQIIQMEKEDAYSKLKTLVEKHLPNQLDINYVVTNESLILYLPKLIKNGEINLIMLGLKGTGLFKNIFLGSTVIKIIEELNNLIVAFPRIYRAAPKSLIIALNYNFPLNETALDNLLQLLKPSLDHVEFISVIGSKDIEGEVMGYLNQLKDRYHKNIPSSFKIYRGKKSFDEIKSHMEGNNRSILVVQKGSRSLTDHLFRRFFINEVVYDGSIPLIVLPS